MNKIDITLKNTESDNSNLIYVQLVTGLTSAGAGIFGGFLVSYMTIRSNKEKERIIEAEKERQKNEYRDKLLTVVYSDLKDASHNLRTLISEEFWKGSSEEFDYAKLIRTSIVSANFEYLKIPFDTKMTLFSPDVIYSLDNTFHSINSLLKTLLSILDEHERFTPASTARLEKSVKRIGIDQTVRTIDESIEELKKIIPKSIT